MGSGKTVYFEMIFSLITRFRSNTLRQLRPMESNALDTPQLYIAMEMYVLQATGQDVLGLYRLHQMLVPVHHWSTGTTRTTLCSSSPTGTWRSRSPATTSSQVGEPSLAELIMG